MENDNKEKKGYKIFTPEPIEPLEEAAAEPVRVEPIGDFRKKNDYQLSLEDEENK